MAVAIRLARSGGRKKLPFFSVVAADSRMPRDGRFLEKLGYYNPTESFGADRLKLDAEAITKWLEKGAQPSETLQKIFLKEGIGSDKQKAKWTKSIEAKGKIAAAKKAAEAAAEAEAEAE